MTSPQGSGGWQILLIASSDSYNHTLPPLVKALLRAGHSVSLLQTTRGAHDTYMLDAILSQVKVYDLHHLPTDWKFDLALFENFLEQDLVHTLRDHGVFMLGMSFHMASNKFMVSGALAQSHAIVCRARGPAKRHLSTGMLIPMIALGSPQDDTIYDHHTAPSTPRSLLFLEQHFYPVGLGAKKELAHSLLQTASENPDWQISIKPRVLPHESRRGKHIATHLYDILPPKRPPNLLLIKEHRDLNELILQSTAVVTCFSTAIYPALLASKQVAWLEGFSDQNECYFSKPNLKAYYDCIPPHQRLHPSQLSQALNHLLPVEAHYLQSEVSSFNAPVSEALVELVDWICRKNAQGIAPFQKGEMIEWRSPQSFEEVMKTSVSCTPSDLSFLGPIASPQWDLYHRLLSEWSRIDALSGGKLTDLKASLVLKMKSCWQAPDQFAFKSKREWEIELFHFLYEEVEKMLLFSLPSPETFPTAIWGWYVTYLVEKKQITAFSPSIEAIGCLEMDFYKGVLAEQRGQWREAFLSWNRFVQKAQQADFRASPILSFQNIQKAREAVFLCSLKSGRLVKALQLFFRSPRFYFGKITTFFLNKLQLLLIKRKRLEPRPVAHS